MTLKQSMMFYGEVILGGLVLTLNLAVVEFLLIFMYSAFMHE